MCTTSAGSELSRQVPVDLKPDADLNEGRGCPGHWSSSLAFSSGNKIRSWRAATQAPTTTREDAHSYTQQENSIADCPKAHSMPGGTAHVRLCISIASILLVTTPAVP